MAARRRTPCARGPFPASSGRATAAGSWPPAELNGVLRRAGERDPDQLAVAARTHGLLTIAAGTGPPLALVDDLHRLDPAAAAALVFADRRLGSDSGVRVRYQARPARAGGTGCAADRGRCRHHAGASGGPAAAR